MEEPMLSTKSQSILLSATTLEMSETRLEAKTDTFTALVAQIHKSVGNKNEFITELIKQHSFLE